MAKRQVRFKQQASPPAVPQGRAAVSGTSRNSVQARRKRAKRRQRHLFLFRLLCCVLVCMAAVLATTVFFRVSNVEIVGDTRYTTKELIDASGIQNGDNMFFLDGSHVSEVLEAQYPYLSAVKIHRKFPSTLQIEVSDRTPILSVDNGGEYLLLDSTGKVLDRVSEAAENTAVVSGAEEEDLEVGSTVGEAEEKLQTALDIMAMMTQYSMNADVKSMDISKTYDVQIEYANRYSVLLGNMDDLEHKIQFLQAILKEASLPETGIIDLTDTDGKEARYRPAESSSNSDSMSTDSSAEEESQSDTAASDTTDGSQQEDRAGSEQDAKENTDAAASDASQDGAAG